MIVMCEALDLEEESKFSNKNFAKCDRRAHQRREEPVAEQAVHVLSCG
jgi:hypothetical protein